VNELNKLLSLNFISPEETEQHQYREMIDLRYISIYLPGHTGITGSRLVLAIFHWLASAENKGTKNHAIDQQSKFCI
jgi:hypothetical protein